MFCQQPLGSNEVLESFPVGRRLAFDAAKGRLWVVCKKCQRWNLTPVEERWEAVETCERVFRETRTRVSTENIGLARHKLVRIGEPPRGEFAPWRYGNRFGTRLRHHGLLLAGLSGSMLGGALAWAYGVPTAVFWVLAAYAYPSVAWAYLRPWVKVRIGGKAGADSAVTPKTVAKFRLLDLTSIRVVPDDSDSGFGVEITRSLRRARFEGEDARRVAGTIVPLPNGGGGSRPVVHAPCTQSSPAATPAVSSPMWPGMGTVIGEAGRDTSAACPSPFASPLKCPFTRNRNGERWKVNSGFCSRHEKRQKRSQPSRTASCFPQGRTPFSSDAAKTAECMCQG